MIATLAERGWVPDTLVRMGIRELLRQRLRDEARREKSGHDSGHWAEQLRQGPVALETDKANEQHYELPPEFFRLVLGPHRKYSSCYWDENAGSLEEAEALALDTTCERAGLTDGQDILELGCGWGSLTLWMARRYPAARILAVSNSAPQREAILGEATARGHDNIEVVTADINNFKTEHRFDRVVSVEMFEHVRNYEELLRRIHGWLRDHGRLFVHIFTHRTYSYPFETEGSGNWMGRYFFTGGQMPSHDLLPRFDRHMTIEKSWDWNGRHYHLTSEAWLENMDRHRKDILKIFREIYGRDASLWFNRWRIFFLACAELFGYDQGREWGVSHYLFQKTQETA